MRPLLVGLLLVWVGVADAKPRRARQPFAVELETATAVAVDHSLSIHFRISRDSWRFLTSHRVDVTMSVAAREVHVASHIDAREQSFSVQMPDGDVPDVQLSLTGSGPDTRVAGIKLDRTRATVVSIPIIAAPRNWSAEAGVISACTDVFEGAENEQACLAAVGSVHYDPTAVIRACDLVMEGDPNELACVRLAANAWTDPSDALRRCESAMEGDTNELACFQLVASASYAAGPMIDACDAAMDGDTNELACITAAVRVATDPSAIIKRCVDTMDGDDAELRCIQDATTPR